MNQTQNRPADAGSTDTQSELRSLPLATIVASLTNPRRFFNEPRLQQLADNIRAVGVMQPVLVRPLPPSRLAETFTDRKGKDPLPGYELISGERRWRASKLVGLANIPAIVRQLTDQEVLEQQLVENLQRDDLHPMEEAEGYERLMSSSGTTVEQMAERIGKSTGTVYARLKLLALTEKARTAFFEDQIDTSRALVIARIPDSRLQLQALERATERDWQGEVSYSFRAFAKWARQQFMLPLDAAPFKITDANLVADAGSCRECPKRTGAQPDIFADVQSKDTCTDPACYRAKLAAHEAQTIAQARAKGQEVIAGDEAAKLWPSAHGEIKGYKRVDVNDSRTGSKKALKSLMGKDAPVPTLLQSPHDGRFVEVLPVSKVNEILKGRGLITAAQAKPDDDGNEYRLRVKFGREWRLRAIERTYTAVRQQQAEGLSEDTMRLVALMLTSQLRADDYNAMAKLIDLGKVQRSEALRDLIKTGDQKVVSDLVHLLLMHADMGWNDYELVADGNHPRLDAIAAEFGVDLAELRKEVAAEQKAELKAKADKKAGKTTEAKPTEAPKPKAKPARTTKAEAAAAIAEGLQQLDAAGNAGEGATEGEDTGAETDYEVTPVSAWPFPKPKEGQA